MKPECVFGFNFFDVKSIYLTNPSFLLLFLSFFHQVIVL
ncbi:hypothetical protein FLJC2902T_29140 [Flavobacterium limnosediminis JC2902]|uniref:Uncharacterized protein n=1 Tax=Flavobacterium limnosediminis JC2902 TaxID=1341181 RepID=V6SJI6_9FLAO|nr:hypothetical protein FLJC2902T_29140 [Flavobacterium limnosediminis JC2902]